MRLREYAVHADYVRIRKCADADQSLIDASILSTYICPKMAIFDPTVARATTELEDMVRSQAALNIKYPPERRA